MITLFMEFRGLYAPKFYVFIGVECMSVELRKKQIADMIEKIINPELKKIAKEYIKLRMGSVGSIETVRSDAEAISFFGRIIDKVYITKQDAIKYIQVFGSTHKKITLKTHTLRVAKFLEEMDIAEQEAIRLLRSIKVKKEDKTRIKSKKDLLTKEEVRMLVLNAPSPKMAALIAVLYETGARIDELLNVKIGDIEFHEQYAEIYIRKSKTRERSVPIIESLPYLLNWLRVHPHRNDKEAYVFNSRKTKQKMTTLNADILIKRLGKKVLRRNVYPHLFRHTRVTHLMKKMKESPLKQLMGWTKDSRMLGVYDHLDDSDAMDEYMQLYGLVPRKNDEVPLDITIECPRCGMQNMQNAIYCNRCGFLLKIEHVEKVKQAEELGTRILRLVLQDPEVKAVIKKKLEEVQV